MEKSDNPRASSPNFWNLKMLADVVTEEYVTSTTKEDNSKSPTCPSTKPRVSVSRPSRKSRLDVLAEVAAIFALAREQEQEEEEEARLFVNVTRKKRSLCSSHQSSSPMVTQWTRAIEKQRSMELQNPNTPSSSGSKMRAIEKQRLMELQQNPNTPSSCISESKKRRFEVGSSSTSRPKEELRIEQNPNLDLESSCVSKKPKTVLSKETNTPEWLVNVMMREGNGYNPKLIIRRTLYKSDLDSVQARLSMPLNQVVNTDFLTEDETRIIYQQSVLKSRKEGVSIDLVDPLLNKHEVDLRKWKMSGNWNYVIVVGWNDVVAKNTFRVGDVLHVWSFRSGIGKLCFAFVPPTPTSNCSQGCSTSGESGH